jgi:hypothetical protein
MEKSNIIVENPQNIIKPENSSELGVEGLNIEQDVERPVLSTEEQLKNLDGGIGANQQEITRLVESVEETKTKLKQARENLGLPLTEEDPPSVLSEKEKLEKLQAEQEMLKKQKEDLISQQEREELIKEEKEKILQEKINELFKEFEALQVSGKFEGVLKGDTNFESKSVGSIGPEDMKALAKIFQEGIKLLPKILEILPELLKQFDKDLEKEAEERVDKKLEEEKKKLEDNQKKEEKPEGIKQEGESKVIENPVLPNETKTEVNSAGNVGGDYTI